MKFIDTAEIKVKAGDGGQGMVHFRREKYVPFGGPEGGHGGHGGDVILEASEGLGTLLDFRYQRFHQAEDGGKGGTSNKQGRRGDPLILKVPCGTVCFDVETGEMLGEVLQEGDRLTVATGGKGGIGNSAFATSRNQAPTKSIPPGPGESRHLRLELKMIADVGIIGSPNAGKSTLVTVVSAARPKVADYPFTTLVPTLGVVSHRDANPFVMADVPGLIPGAAAGKGLGHDFLRHIERTRALIHLVDGSQETTEKMIEDFEGILQELRLYNQDLLARPRLTVISKIDVVSLESEEEAPEREEAALEGFKKYLKSKKIEHIEISSAQRVGITEMLDKILTILSSHDDLS